jgi:nitroimidazol reductase NimA-like FMN-containing flavoprotein (pyridoxamine 5'-phosphate oxidase superfamily)
MKQRDLVAMTAEETSAMLAGHRKVQLASLNADGSVHLVTMYYGLVGGRIAFWTYRSSQKALNLARDPRVTCLVEDGDEYFDLRGVQIIGTIRLVDDLAGVLEIGRLIAGSLPGVPAEGVEEYVAHAARKRVGYLVEPQRIITWDHSKLAQG